jgi:hypothetical protein
MKESGLCLNIIDQLFEIFKDGLTLEQFRAKVDALNGKKNNFLNASLLCRQALRCKGCEPNIAMMLLCSCADAMKFVRKGKPRENFKKFYRDYSPIVSRNPPIMCYFDDKPLIYNVPSFDETLEYIYKRFRNLYTHEGTGLLELPKSPDLIWYGLCDKLEETSNKTYVTDIVRILDWFATITKESLRNILFQQKCTI